MGIITGVFIYLLIWWVIIFCTLPLKFQRLEKNTDGSMPGAPVHPQMKFKIILTTVISAVLWAVIELVIRSGWISYHDIAQRMAM